MQETVAAAMVRMSDWDGRLPLADPMCGTGTLVIEAALIARRIAPGAGRRFAVERWPGLAPGTRDALDDEVAQRRRPLAHPVRGADRNAGAVALAARNAARAGVGDDVGFEAAPVSALHLDEPPGLVVCNPPYGQRVGRGDTLRNLYARLGQRLRQGAPGWRLALVTASPDLAHATGLALEPLTSVVPHGGLRVRFYAGKVAPTGDVSRT